MKLDAGALAAALVASGRTTRWTPAPPAAPLPAPFSVDQEAAFREASHAALLASVARELERLASATPTPAQEDLANQLHQVTELPDIALTDAFWGVWGVPDTIVTCSDGVRRYSADALSWVVDYAAAGALLDAAFLDGGAVRFHVDAGYDEGFFFTWALRLAA